MAHDPYIGRREAVGLGIEATPGTAVAPQTWLIWEDNSIQPRTNVVENESALGVVDRTNDSEVTSRWVEGTIGGKVTDHGVGFLLLGVFGSVSTGTAASGMYPHTFSVNQSSIGKTLTLARSTPGGDKRHAYAVVDTFELTAESNEYVRVSSAIKARIGASSSETVVITDEKEFTSKDIVLKTAANVAGLSGANPIDAVSLQLNINRESEKHDRLGTSDEPVFDKGTFEANGEFVVRYKDSDIEDDFLGHVTKALNITMTNGTTSLSFTAPKVKYTELEKSTDRDGIVTQTVQFMCRFDMTSSKSIEAVLTNSRATYTAAA